MTGRWRRVQVDFFVVDDIEDRQVDEWLRTERTDDFPRYPIFWLDEIESDKNA